MHGHTGNNGYSTNATQPFFTRREAEILHLMVADLSNAEIAERLVVAPGTVKWYVKEIYSKLGAHSRLEAIRLAADHHLLSTTPSAAPRTNLPAYTNSFIGRARDVAGVRARLLRDDVRLLTLVGTAGVGKTRLSVEVAGTLLNEFVDGVYFVSLAPLSDVALVLDGIAQALAVETTEGESVISNIKRHLQAHRVLLVLDNMEHVLSAALPIADLLSAAPGLKVLATSREPLRLYGEQEYRVSPLSLPKGMDEHCLHTLARSEAAILFVERTRAVKPDFEVTAENAATVAQLCNQLDGLPLAIELAANKMKRASSQALLKQLDKRLTTLTDGPRDLPSRHQSWRAALAWSYQLLTAAEQQLFIRLGSFSERWKADMLLPLRLEGLEVDAALEALVRKQLVEQAEDVHGEPYWYMLTSIREYALEKWAEYGEQAYGEETSSLEEPEGWRYFALERRVPASDKRRTSMIMRPLLHHDVAAQPA